MSLLQGLVVPENLEKEDTSAFEPLPSGIYEAVIHQAYVKQSPKGAKAIDLTLRIPSRKNFQIQEDIYFTNKKGEVFWTKNGLKNPLPGYSKVDELCQIVAGVRLPEMTEEKKLVQRWSKDAKALVPEQVDTLPDLLDQPVTIVVLEKKLNKTQDRGDGVWVDTNDVLIKNEIQKFLRDSDGLCLTEINSGSTKRAYAERWLARNEGLIKDTYKPVANAAPAAATQASAFTGAANSAPTKSLFKQEDSTPQVDPVQAESTTEAPRFETNG